MRILIILLMTLTISALIIISNNNFYLLDNSDMENFLEEYILWADNTLTNLFSITGKVSEMNWVP